MVSYRVPELITDTVVLTLVLLRAHKLDTKPSIGGSGWLWRELIRGNVFYFFAMAMSNVVTIFIAIVCFPLLSSEKSKARVNYTLFSLLRLLSRT